MIEVRWDYPDNQNKTSRGWSRHLTGPWPSHSLWSTFNYSLHVGQTLASNCLLLRPVSLWSLLPLTRVQPRRGKGGKARGSVACPTPAVALCLFTKLGLGLSVIGSRGERGGGGDHYNNWAPYLVRGAHLNGTPLDIPLTDWETWY